jgi:NAD(P)-dependent dehydrogenase (short-subunit alcohol dehydrogenase family)
VSDTVRSHHEAPDLAGKVALVTGSSRGLGREMALAFARAGADVVITSRKLGPCEEVAHEVVSTTGRRALAIAAHAGKWADSNMLAERVLHEWGRVDVLVNNVGMSPLFDDLTSVTEELYDKTFDVNVKGAFRLTALLGSHMAAHDGGSIINVSSFASLSPQPYFLVYAAAKAALNALTVGFARAFGPTVRVNGILPGPFRTDIADHWPPETADRHRATLALERAGEPDEIVGAALYFASGMSTYTTGALLRVDGGPR